MTNTKQYRSVSELLDGVSDDRSLSDDLHAYANERQMTQFLSATRCTKGLSQDDIAKRLNCSQGYISKLENSIDDDLKFGEVDRYLAVMGLKATIGISDKNATTLDEIKNHVFLVKNKLEEIAELSRPGDGSAESALFTVFEVMINSVTSAFQSIEKIPFEGMDRLPSCRLEISFSDDEIAPEALGLQDDDCATPQ